MLRENTCPIASGDYSTPVSQRTKIKDTFMTINQTAKKLGVSFI